MKIHAFRLKPGDDLKLEIESLARARGIRAGFILTCVGGLEKATLRSADIERGKPSKQDVLVFTGSNDNNFEIASLVGTISVDGVRLHMSIADNKGRTFGGHLKEATTVHPTAEIVIGEDEQSIYTREPDQETGFMELNVKKDR